MGLLADWFTNIFTAPARERTKSVKRELRTLNTRASAGGAVNMGRGMATGEKFYHGLPSLPNSLELDNWSLRHNVRNLMYSSGPARAVVDRFAQFEVNKGLRLRVSPNAEILGISKDEAEAWGKNFSSRFNLWAGNKKCSLDGHDNLFEGQHFYSKQQHRDNDIFIRLHYSKSSDLLNPLQFQFLDPDQIAGDAYTQTDGTYPCTIDDGIVRDENGVEIGYKVLVTDKKNHTKTVTVKSRTKDGMAKMLHIYERDFAGQKRGYPEMSHAIQTFANLTGFTIAQIQKAINQSNFAFYTKPSDDAPASNPLEAELENRGPVPSDFIGSNPESAEEITDEDVMELSLLPEFNVSQPGSIWLATLNKGEEAVPIENTAPADRYDSFVDSFTTHLAADCSMPIEILLMKFGENYSASRATLVLFWMLIERKQANMAWDWLNVMVEMWAIGEIAAGRIKAPGWSDPRLREAWMQLRWIGTPMPEIDELKAAKASKERAELGHETLDDGALKHNGSDGQANRAQLTKEFEELPLAPWSNAAAQQNVAQGEQKEEDDDD